MAKKGGKYSAVLGGLPTLGIDPTRLEAVEKAQEQIKSAIPTGFGPSMNELLGDTSSLISSLVELKKRQTANRPYAAEYARAYAECRAIRDTIAEWDGAFSLLIEAYQWLMLDAMQAEGMLTAEGKGSLTANGQPVHTYREPIAKVEDPELYRQWCAAPEDVCMACGYTEEIHVLDAPPPETRDHPFTPGGGLERKMGLLWQVTNALAKERLLAGEDAPPGVTVSAKTVVRLGASDE